MWQSKRLLKKARHVKDYDFLLSTINFFFHQLRKFYEVYVDDIGRNARIEKKGDGRETGEPLARSSWRLEFFN